MLKQIGIFIGLLYLGLGIAQANSCGEDKKLCDIEFFSLPDIEDPTQCEAEQDLVYVVKNNTPVTINLTSQIVTLPGDTSPSSTVTVTGGTCANPVPAGATCTVDVTIIAAPSTATPFPQQIERQLQVMPDTLQQNPITSNIELEVDCNLQLTCATVGYFTSSNKNSPLSYTSNDFGNSWSISTGLPPPQGIIQDRLLGISCGFDGSKDSCAAVGFYDTSSKDNLFAIPPLAPLSYYSTDFGDTWTVSSPLPLPQEAFDNALYGVSCLGVSGKCAAVGYYQLDIPEGLQVVLQNRSLSYYSTDFGQTWTVSTLPVLTPPAATGNNLTSVSCVVGDQCAAVGYYSLSPKLLSDPISPLSYYSTDFGQTWTASSMPLPTPSDDAGQEDLLLGVSCVIDSAITKCAAVGYYKNNSGNRVPLSYISVDAGATWSLSSSLPAPQGGIIEELFGVSCLSDGHCVAAGATRSSSGLETPLLYYSTDYGDTWTLSTFTPYGSIADGLNSVSCLSDGHCTAVGESYTGTTQIPLSYASSDFGVTWTSNLPASHGIADFLNSVSCVLPPRSPLK